jgi:hypothetical protein
VTTDLYFSTLFLNIQNPTRSDLSLDIKIIMMRCTIFCNFLACKIHKAINVIIKQELVHKLEPSYNVKFIYPCVDTLLPVADARTCLSHLLY